MQHKILLPVGLTVFAIGFLLLSFFQEKLWVKSAFHTGDSLAVLFRYLFVN